MSMYRVEYKQAPPTPLFRFKHRGVTCYVLQSYNVYLCKVAYRLNGAWIVQAPIRRPSRLGTLISKTFETKKRASNAAKRMADLVADAHGEGKA